MHLEMDNLTQGRQAQILFKNMYYSFSRFIKFIQFNIGN